MQEISPDLHSAPAEPFVKELPVLLQEGDFIIIIDLDKINYETM
jgi:hypothetical protein